MDLNQLSMEELAVIGETRLLELEQLDEEVYRIYETEPHKFDKKLHDCLLKLSWIDIEENIETPNELTKLGGFSLAVLEIISIIKQIANEWGLVIFGYLNKLILSYNFKASAGYFPQSRNIRINIGILMFLSELSFTYNWIENLLFGQKRASILLDKLGAANIPNKVFEELIYVFQAFKTGGILISGKSLHPIGLSTLHFIFSHEFGHLIYCAAPPQVKDFWLKTAWSDYDDALANDYRLRNLIGQSELEYLNRYRLDKVVAENWVQEFIADGLGCYIASHIKPKFNIDGSEIDPQISQQFLPIAIEIFFHVLVILYHQDASSVSHPAPLLRESVIVARLRKNHKMDWVEFLAEVWGSGTATRILFEKIMSSIFLSKSLRRNINESI